MGVLVEKLTIADVDPGPLPLPGGGDAVITPHSLTINPAGDDADIELILNRTTGGPASLKWNGDTIQCSKPFVPVELGIHNISASAPSTTFPGQVWLYVS
jgi:hypothetical protein